MKKYKTLSLVIFYIVFVGIGLVFGITPENIIEAYAEGPLDDGNMLAYYNKFRRIIVLKNGIYRIHGVREGQGKALASANMLERVFEPTLAEVIAFSTGKHCQKYCHFYFNGFREYMSAKTIKQEDLQRFLDLILKERNDFSGLIIAKTNKELSLPRGNTFSEALTDYCKDGENGLNLCHLGNFQHTEVQLEALYRAYNGLVEYLSENIDYKANNIKIFLENLLPVILTEPGRNDIDYNIYSLYEACKVCRKVNWLQNKKVSFKFKVIDRQGQVEKEKERFYALDEMQTQAELEAWQNRQKQQPKNGLSSVTSFAPGHFRSKQENSFKSFEQINIK